eukprot:TRINITY_DN13368_c0_g1_i1.p1 TRINITY_DN13368_c0_g1~~TRINITY_DN13368_c0_g1_i1.p1  ORF type:complete len:659 (+),score=186.94 TRINITY_DN13368_c0_g1_i1:93-2069(+)
MEAGISVSAAAAPSPPPPRGGSSPPRRLSVATSPPALRPADGVRVQVSLGAPMASPLSPTHRLHSGDPSVSLVPTPGRPSPPPAALSPAALQPPAAAAAEAAPPRQDVPLPGEVLSPSAPPHSPPPGSSLVQCPICFRSFPDSAIAAHCGSCGRSTPPPQPDEMMPRCDACGEALQLVAGRLARDAAYYMNDCPHVFSRRCLRKHIQQRIREAGATRTSVSCPAPGCQRQVASCDLLNFVSREEHERLLTTEIAQFVAADSSRSYVQCPGCHAVIERDTQSPPPPETEELEVGGRKVSKEQYQHHQAWRFRCRGCGAEFCGSCGAMPYHQGLLCDQRGEERQPCRFCDEQRATGELVCGSAECAQKSRDICQKTLPCGHLCGGVRDEVACPPCLHSDCASSGVRTGSDWCSICYTEELRAAPVVTLSCEHTFHFNCLRARLLNKWPGPRITFTFLNCPECGQEIDHPAYASILSQLRRFREDVRKRALLRLRHERLDRDPAVADPGGPHYNDPAGYAAHVLCYYQCYVCERPYFGGLHRCEMAQDDHEQFNPSELVCATCVPFRDLKSCHLHGTDFIEFKCKFCCSIAQWFCWGTTHFCASCHRLQERGDFVTKKKPAELPQCGNKESCPLRIDHPPNGTTEFALGCALCRFLSEAAF